MRKSRSIFWVACFIIMAFLIVPARAEAKTAKLNQTNLSMTAGTSRRLSLTKQKKKVAWSVISGKKYVRLSDKKKTGVKITGIKAGTARVQAKIGNKKLVCKVTVKQKNSNGYTMYLKIKKRVFRAEMVDNSSTRALKKLLQKGPLTIQMEDYGNMEKTGSIGRGLPKNDRETTTEAGDLILYQGDTFVIYYAPNTWGFTRLGKIKNVSEAELKKVLGKGDVTVTLSLNKNGK